MASPTPAPTHLKLVRGTLKPCRTNAAEPKLEPGTPPMHPSIRTAGAKRAWRHFVKITRDMGVLTVADGPALAELANVSAEVDMLRQDLETHGYFHSPIVLGADGMPIDQPRQRARPQVAMLSDASRRLSLMLGAFGLNPSARAKVSTVKPRAPGKKDRFGL